MTNEEKQALKARALKAAKKIVLKFGVENFEIMADVIENDETVRNFLADYLKTYKEQLKQAG